MSTCPYCRSPGIRVREFQQRTTERLCLWRCGSCQCEFLEPQPSDAWLAHEYSGYFQMREGQTPAPKARLCRMILEKLGPLPHSPQALEIGGGEGHFVRELLTSHPTCSITLVEPQADPAIFPKDKVTVYNMLVEEWMNTQGPAQYDVIVAMDLIEHLREPVEVIRQLVNTHLKPGGTLIITTPNARSIFRRCLGRLWPHYKVEHLTYPSVKALCRLSSECGLHIRELQGLAKPLQIGYLITILKNFGPQAVRTIGRIIDALCPAFMRPWHVRIPSGELLFVATRSPSESRT
jgi:hypothetical protein